LKFKSKIFYLYVVLVIVYAGLTLLLPAPIQTLHRYHLSILELRLLDITIIVPLALIWLAGFYGYAKLKTYSMGIRRARDGRHVDKIASGVLLLVLWLPLSSIVANLLHFIAYKHPSTTAATVVIDNYFNLLVPLAGFIVIGIGVEGLARLARLHLIHRSLNILAGILVVVGVFYSYLVVSTDNRLLSLYHLPLAVVLLTLVVPYIYMWYMGLLAAYKLYLYRQKVAGVVYRKSWGLLAFGISAIIGIQIVLQCIVTLTTQLNRLSLGWLLIFIYILLILIAIGYVLIAQGAKNLQKIEEV
jgi:hypothetical protein